MERLNAASNSWRGKTELLEDRKMMAVLTPGDFGWALQIGTGGRSASDSQGNVYVAGTFSATEDFDPGPATVAITPSNSSPDAFLAKWSAAGELLWVKQFGGSGSESVSAISVDGSGNASLVGEFYGRVDFDPGPNQVFLTADSSSSNVYIAQFSSDGNLRWAKQFEGVGGDTARSLAVDRLGNLAIAGTFGLVGSFFSGSCDFDPGPASSILSSMDGRSFVASLTASGEFRWVRQYTADVRAVAFDKYQEVVIAGGFISDFYVDPSSPSVKLTAQTSAAFVLQLSPTGAFNWARQIVGNGSGGGINAATGLSVAVDSQRNVVLGGNFKGTISFGASGSGPSLVAVAKTDAFVAKWSPLGSLLWAKSFGSVGDDDAANVAVMTNDNVAVAGEFEFTVDFDPNAGLQTRTSDGGKDTYVLGLTKDGSFRWVSQFGGFEATLPPDSIAVRLGRDVLLAGGYRGTVSALPNGPSLILPPPQYSPRGFALLVNDPTMGPITRPGVPSQFAAVAGNTQAMLSWAPPASDGGSAITDYLIQVSMDDGATWASVNDGGSASTSTVVTGLTNGAGYVFRIAAVNAIGASEYSANSAAVFPTAVPGPPTAVTGKPGDGQVSVGWKAPASSGASPISDYIVQYSTDEGVTWTTFSDGTSTVTSASVIGLTNGIRHLFRVAAVSSDGTGLFSAFSPPLTPKGIPVNSARIEVLRAAVVEPGTSPASIAVFTLKITGEVVTPFFVFYSTRDGSARADSDYRANSGRTQILPGQSEKRITVGVVGDTALEQDEFFWLDVSAGNDPAIVVSSPSVKGWILDDDSRFFTVAAAGAPVAPGGTAIFTVGLGRVSGYGEALPTAIFAGMSPAVVAAAIRFEARFTAGNQTALGAERRPRPGTALEAKNGRISLGYAVGAGGSLERRATATEALAIANSQQARPVAFRLYDQVNARLGKATAKVDVRP
jgi:hypothetical protein